MLKLHSAVMMTSELLQSRPELLLQNRPELTAMHAAVIDMQLKQKTLMSHMDN